MPKFKAHLLPDFDTVNLPEKKVKSVTQTEPFCLETDKRGALKAQTWKHQVRGWESIWGYIMSILGVGVKIRS